MASSSSKTLFALITGLAAGVAIGMLFAPEKGSKTRKRVKKRLMGIADSVKENVDGRFRNDGDEDPAGQ
jgi:gas vesicle protein